MCQPSQKQLLFHRSVIQNFQRHLQNGKGNMEIRGFPKILVSLYQTTRRHNPKQNLLRSPHHMSLTPSISVSLKCLMSVPFCSMLKYLLSNFMTNLHDKKQRYRIGTLVAACVYLLLHRNFITSLLFFSKFHMATLQGMLGN